jgi:hypothetical protein
VAAHFDIDTNSLHVPFDHRISVRLGQWRLCKLAGSSADRLEQCPTRIIPRAGLIGVGINAFFERVMPFHLIPLTTLFMEPHPETPRAQ